MRSDDAGTVSIDWYTQDDTAIAGKDYAAREGTVEFRPGEVVKEVSTDQAVSWPYHISYYRSVLLLLGAWNNLLLQVIVKLFN